MFSGKGRAPVGAGRDHRHSGAGRHLAQELQLLLGPPVDGGVDDTAQAVGGSHAQLFGTSATNVSASSSVSGLSRLRGSVKGGTA